MFREKKEKNSVTSFDPIQLLAGKKKAILFFSSSSRPLGKKKMEELKRRKQQEVIRFRDGKASIKFNNQQLTLKSTRTEDLFWNTGDIISIDDTWHIVVGIDLNKKMYLTVPLRNVEEYSPAKIDKTARLCILNESALGPTDSTAIYRDNFPDCTLISSGQGWAKDCHRSILSQHSAALRRISMGKEPGAQIDLRDNRITEKIIDNILSAMYTGKPTDELLVPLVVLYEWEMYQLLDRRTDFTITSENARWFAEVVFNNENGPLLRIKKMLANLLTTQ